MSLRPSPLSEIWPQCPQWNIIFNHWKHIFLKYLFVSSASDTIFHFHIVLWMRYLLPVLHAVYSLLYSQPLHAQCCYLPSLLSLTLFIFTGMHYKKKTCSISIGSIHILLKLNIAVFLSSQHFTVDEKHFRYKAKTPIWMKIQYGIHITVDMAWIYEC